MLALRCLLALLVLGIGLPAAGEARVVNGFALEPTSIDTQEVLAGGPPRDGIPALDHPRTVTAGEASWADGVFVIGVARGDEARAYPIPILDYHELVNDTLDGQPILVTWCPLCGTGMVFDRRVGGETRRFGVSGLLYRSDVLIFDRGTESLWSQIQSEAVTGSLTGTRLHLLRSTMMRWGDWRAAHPDSTVLSRDTGHARPYDVAPYGDYPLSETLRFPVPSLDRRYPSKMPTLGVRVPGGPARAYPAVELMSHQDPVVETFGGGRIRVSYEPRSGAFQLEAPEGVESVEGYWFAWMAFHPESSVFVSSKEKEE